MRTAYIVSTGTELLVGTTVDTNSVFLADRLQQLGIKVIGKSIVGDNKERIKHAFETGLQQADIVISSGGLGPTRDDLTKEVACELMGCTMRVIDAELDKIKRFFQQRNREMPENNVKQAMFPDEAEILDNKKGTAPGMYMPLDNKLIVLLPGPPREMQYMYMNEVEPRLKRGYQSERDTASITMKVFGPGESQVEALLQDIINNPGHCSIALIAKEGEISIRVTAETGDKELSEKELKKVKTIIQDKLGRDIIGYNEDTMALVVSNLLKNRSKTFCAAESCTGGLLSKLITDISGSSQYFWGSVISYSNETKMKILNVRQDTLEKYGAVSEQTAREMVQGIVSISGADTGIAITGIAGPSGGTAEKPVGLVYIALMYDGDVTVKKMNFAGHREGIRMLAAKTALDLLRRKLVMED